MYNRPKRSVSQRIPIIPVHTCMLNRFGYGGYSRTVGRYIVSSRDIWEVAGATQCQKAGGRELQLGRATKICPGERVDHSVLVFASLVSLAPIIFHYPSNPFAMSVEEIRVGQSVLA